MTHPVGEPICTATERISVRTDAEPNAMTEGLVVPVAPNVTTDNLALAIPGAVKVPALYWSVRGEVACATHVPGSGSQRWSEERWAEVPPQVRSRYGIRYQCQHCAHSKTPIAHRRLNRISVNHADA
jgi:hypothetical protein